MENANKLTAFLTSDARFTRRTLGAVLNGGLGGMTIEEVLAALKESPQGFSADVGRNGDLYLSANN